MIETLIDKVDTFEIVRDQVAAILVTESAAQQVLAAAASEDPRLWQLRVFVERALPWAEFQDSPAQLDAPPIVSVTFESAVFDMGSSNAVERQRATGTVHIDCYGYGVAEDDGADGHIPGDARAGFEVARAVRLVRNILMAARYTYLDLRGTVWRRWIRQLQFFGPPPGDPTVQNIAGARVSLEVDFNEHSPQVQGTPLETLASTVFRAETGEVYLHGPDPDPDP